MDRDKAEYEAELCGQLVLTRLRAGLTYQPAAYPLDSFLVIPH
jgi:hypothetical protein